MTSGRRISPVLAKKLRPTRDRSFSFRRGTLSDARYWRLVPVAESAPPVLLDVPAPTVPLVLAVAPALSVAAPGCALSSSSSLLDAPPCIWLLPCTPPRILVSDEVPCAHTGPASMAEFASAI